VAKLFFEAGHVVLCTFVSPYARDREAVRALFPQGRFVEVHVTASTASLRSRDVKGLYAREASGEQVGLSGVTSPYEAPDRPALLLDTDKMTVEAAVRTMLDLVRGQAPRRPTG
jgi:bifunctional enzyme CysN/CysC